MNTTRAAGPVRGVLATLAVLAVLAAAGCASQAQMTDVWRDSTLPPNAFHRVLVVALRKDAVRRRTWEDAFVTELSARGIAATASYRTFADAPPDTQQVIAAVRSQGYDAVLTSVRMPDEQSTHYVPGVVRTVQRPSHDYFGRFHNYWVNVQEPGYTETDTIVRSQTDVWATTPGNARLVWSGTLQTMESANTLVVAKAVANTIMPEMERQGLVPLRTR